MATVATRPAPELIKNAYDQLFTSGITLSRIRDAVAGDRFFPAHHDASTLGVPGRSILWKLFLTSHEPLQKPATDNPASPLPALRASRVKYRDLLVERMRAPDGNLEDGFEIPGPSTQSRKNALAPVDLETNNPLSLHTENPWTGWFASMDLRKTILQDVERTFPEIGYFRDADVQYQLTNILFLYSTMHPDTGYRQGMHEILAPIYFAVDFDSMSTTDVLQDGSEVMELCLRAWVAADAWALFEPVMAGIGKWYEWRENANAQIPAFPNHVNLHIQEGPVALKPYVAPIVQECDRIHSTLLRTIDPQLYQRMQSVGMEPQIYGIRWLRLIFTREFSMRDAMMLWDGIFTCDAAFEIMPWICVAMLLRIRNELIPSDYTGQVTYLLRFPSQRQAEVHSSVLLFLRQAQELRLSPTPSTGATIVIENYHLLDIPIEVPQPPPPPSRRRLAQDPRTRLGNSSPDSGQASRHGQLGHLRQRSFQQAAGLPEMLAKGLIERGESLGINKTLINAVSELRRSLPDLTAATAFVKSPNLDSDSYAAFPLTSERPSAFLSEERLPEPRTRFDVENDLTQLRTRSKQLGASVAWIVDVLLQDEESSNGEDALQAIQERKREALESLAYVRDALLDDTRHEIDESRLYSEEEFQRRRKKFEQKQIPNAHALSPPTPASIIDTRPKPRYPDSPASSSPITTPPVTSGPGAAMAPDAENMQLPPWNYTKSAFSGPSSLPFASLPRPPPPTSTLRFGSSPSSPPASKAHLFLPRHVSSERAAASALNDPLGAIR